MRFGKIFCSAAILSIIGVGLWALKELLCKD